jgi:hypothetical protein
MAPGAAPRRGIRARNPPGVKRGGAVGKGARVRRAPAGDTSTCRGRRGGASEKRAREDGEEHEQDEAAGADDGEEDEESGWDEDDSSQEAEDDGEGLAFEALISPLGAAEFNEQVWGRAVHATALGNDAFERLQHGFFGCDLAAVAAASRKDDNSLYSPGDVEGFVEARAAPAQQRASRPGARAAPVTASAARTPGPRRAAQNRPLSLLLRAGRARAARCVPRRVSRCALPPVQE